MSYKLNLFSLDEEKILEYCKMNIAPIDEKIEYLRVVSLVAKDIIESDKLYKSGLYDLPRVKSLLKSVSKEMKLLDSLGFHVTYVIEEIIMEDEEWKEMNYERMMQKNARKELENKLHQMALKSRKKELSDIPNLSETLNKNIIWIGRVQDLSIIYNLLKENEWIHPEVKGPQFASHFRWIKKGVIEKFKPDSITRNKSKSKTDPGDYKPDERGKTISKRIKAEK